MGGVKRNKDPPNMPSDTETTYCHVCFSDVPTCKVAKCPHGHACCEKHHIQRVKTIYEEGEIAFNGGSGSGQMCFECRGRIPDSHFSEIYMKLLRLTIAVEISKRHSGCRMTNEGIEDYLRRVKAISS